MSSSVNSSQPADVLSAVDVSYVSPAEASLYVINAVLLVLTVVGNVVTIYVICTPRRAKTTHHVTIVSLAVADIFVACFVLPLYLLTPRADLVADAPVPFICKLSRYVWYWCKTVSAYSIVAMVIDKHAQRRRPLPHRKARVMSGRCLFFLNFMWFFGAAYNIWQVVLTASAKLSLSVGGPHPNVTLRRCVALDTMPRLLAAFAVTDMVVIFIVPGVAVCRLYVSMAVSACGGGGGEREGGPGAAGRTRRLLLSASLALIFLLCHLPVEILKAHELHQHEAPSAAQLTLAELLDTLAFAHGFFNVIAYAVFSQGVYNCASKVVRRNNMSANTRTTSLPVIVQTSVDGVTMSETIT